MRPYTEIRNSKTKSTETVSREKVQQVIIHLHGGGPYGQQSEAAEHYLRKWANQLNVPLFCIDYTMEASYVETIDEAYQAYYWIVTQVKQHMGIDPKRVVLSGDANGGHLAQAITILSILRNFRTPNSLVLHQPICNSNLNHFFPSTMLALDDIFVNYSMLNYLQARGGGKLLDPTQNCLLSPIYTPRSILQKFPQTKILIAELDPLRDTGIYFALQLSKAYCDVEVFYMKDYISNFLQYDSLSFGIPEFRQAHELTMELFRRMLGN